VTSPRAAAAAATATAAGAGAAGAAGGSKATVQPSMAEEPNVSFDAASKKMIIKFVTVSSTEPSLAWTFAGKPIALTGGQYSMSKVVKDGQYFYTFEISEVRSLAVATVARGDDFRCSLHLASFVDLQF